MSPNAGLVRSFPQTSIKALRKRGGPVGSTWAVGSVRMRRIITNERSRNVRQESLSCIEEDRRRNLR